MMKKASQAVLTIVGFMAIALLVTACGKYNYAPPLDEDQKKAKPEVYGEVGGPAKQHKNTYPADPNATARGAEVKDKLKKTQN